MYHPYLRGKQYELLTVRENAARMAGADFVPIIEPVKTQLGGLDRALKDVCDADGSAIVIINPHHGEHSKDGGSISSLLGRKFLDRPGVSAGILLKNHTSLDEVIGLIQAHDEHPLTLVHAGFLRPGELAEWLDDEVEGVRHVFFEASCGRTYRRHFPDGQRVLLRDGFQKRNNRDYPPVERFSDLHLTFSDEGMNGFGDFLMVGDEFSSSGGPAYAVAIHLTFINPTGASAVRVKIVRPT